MIYVGGRTYGVVRVRLLDVALELREAGAVPVQVDVVEEAPAAARVDHLVQPVKALVRARARGDGGERLLDLQGVDVLLVPRRRLAGRDAVDVGLVEREDGWKSSLAGVYGRTR